MGNNQIDYHDIARIQIDTAIDLYQNKNFICAIVLAKAGEEFLGKHLKEDSAHARLKSEVLKKDPYLEKHLNRIASFFRHGSDLDLFEKEINIKAEAIQYIIRGVLNYLTFTKHLTSSMELFVADHTPEKIDNITEETHA